MLVSMVSIPFLTNEAVCTAPIAALPQNTMDDRPSRSAPRSQLNSDATSALNASIAVVGRPSLRATSGSSRSFRAPTARVGVGQRLLAGEQLLLGLLQQRLRRRLPGHRPRERLRRRRLLRPGVGRGLDHRVERRFGGGELGDLLVEQVLVVLEGRVGGEVELVSEVVPPERRHPAHRPQLLGGSGELAPGRRRGEARLPVLQRVHQRVARVFVPDVDGQVPPFEPLDLEPRLRRAPVLEEILPRDLAPRRRRRRAVCLCRHVVSRSALGANLLLAHPRVRVVRGDDEEVAVGGQREPVADAQDTVTGRGDAGRALDHPLGLLARRELGPVHLERLLEPEVAERDAIAEADLSVPRPEDPFDLPALLLRVVVAVIIAKVVTLPGAEHLSAGPGLGRLDGDRLAVADLGVAGGGAHRASDEQRHTRHRPRDTTVLLLGGGAGPSTLPGVALLAALAPLSRRRRSPGARRGVVPPRVR